MITFPMKPQAPGSARWIAFQNLGKQVTDLGVFLILAKLLSPVEFGIVAMAGSLIVLINVLCELGLGDALVQRQDLDADHLDAAFWTALISAGTCALTIYLLAPSIASIYGQPDVEYILRALTPLFLFQGLTVVPQAVLQRSFGFRQLALRSLLGSVIGGSVALLGAKHGAGAWSLVGQQLSVAAVSVLGLWCFSSWRPRRSFKGSRAKELLAFGRSVIGARVLNVAASKLDDFIVGLFLGPVALGVYSVACRMLLALEQLFCQGIDTIALAAFSRASGDLPEMRRLFSAATKAAAVLAAPVFCGVAILAPEIIRATLGERWIVSAPVLQILLLAGFIHALMHFNHAVFKACDQPHLSVRVAAYSTGLNFITLMLAVRYGVVAVAVSYLIRSVLIAPVGLRMAMRLIDFPYGSYCCRGLFGRSAEDMGLAWSRQLANDFHHQRMWINALPLLVTLVRAWRDQHIFRA
jgi:O-antigen/teichoic acid export membrane protein